jgi:hypothetical protein
MRFWRLFVFSNAPSAGEFQKRNNRKSSKITADLLRADKSTMPRIKTRVPFFRQRLRCYE